MSHRGEKTLKEVIEELIAAYGISNRLDEIDLRAWWLRTMGEDINALTSKIILRDKRLFLTIESAALKAELMMARGRLRTSINRQAGKRLVDEIIIL
jgi:hypothetical protein